MLMISISGICIECCNTDCENMEDELCCRCTGIDIDCYCYNCSVDYSADQIDAVMMRMEGA